MRSDQSFWQYVPGELVTSYDKATALWLAPTSMVAVDHMGWLGWCSKKHLERVT